MTVPDTDSPPAHIVLRNGDILPVILDALNPDILEWMDEKECRERRRTLSKLARVCRIFKDPALSILWRVQQGLKPFLAFIPESFAQTGCDQVWSSHSTIWNVYLLTRLGSRR